MYVILGLPELIGIVVGVFFLTIGVFYVYRSFSGPRKIDEIEKLLEQGRHQTCITELQKLLEQDERDIDSRFLLARTYMNMKDYGTASIELRQCVKYGRYSEKVTEKKVRSALAKTLLELSNLTEAKNEYLILTTLDPGNFENFYQVGKLFFRGGESMKAFKFLQKAVALNPRHADSLSLLGQANYHQNNYQDAKNYLSKAVQVKPDLYLAHYYLGLCLRYLQDTEWALKEFDKAERDPGLKAKAILGKGMILIDQESYPRAISELDRGLAYVSQGSDTEVNMRYMMGMAAEKSRDMHTAIVCWERIEKIRPQFRDVREKLRQYAEFRMDDAIKDFMIASTAAFEEICRTIVANLKQHVISLDVQNDVHLRILATEEDTGKRNYRKPQTLYWINRDNMTTISENHVRDFQNEMKSQNATRGVIMTTGEVSNSAQEYATSRPVEILDTGTVADYVRQATEK